MCPRRLPPMHHDPLGPADWRSLGGPAEELHSGQWPRKVRQVRHFLLHCRVWVGNDQDLSRPAFHQKGLPEGVAGRRLGGDIPAIGIPDSAMAICQFPAGRFRELLPGLESPGDRLGGCACNRCPGDRLGGWVRGRTGLVSAPVPRSFQKGSAGLCPLQHAHAGRHVQGLRPDEVLALVLQPLRRGPGLPRAPCLRRRRRWIFCPGRVGRAPEAPILAPCRLALSRPHTAAPRLLPRGTLRCRTITAVAAGTPRGRHLRAGGDWLSRPAVFALVQALAARRRCQLGRAGDGLRCDGASCARGAGTCGLARRRSGARRGSR